MKRSFNCAIGILMVLCLILLPNKTVSASDGEYITISVDATDDNDENLLYALDTDDPSAFTSSNEFSVPAGTNHTIYVKDAAGNISSQEYTSFGSHIEAEEDERTVNIDITLNDTPDYSDHDYENSIHTGPAETGQGTVYDKVSTDIADPNAERIFYTITTDEGEVFYMVIDQGQNNNNVYLLDQVNLSDLKSLAVNDSDSGDTQTEGTSSLLSALNSNESNADVSLLESNADASSNKSSKNSMTSNLVILLIIAVVGGGFYYYKNIYKNKKDEQMDLIDAPDKDDFAAEDEYDEDEADFGLDEDYQEKIMNQLMEEEEVEKRNEYQGPEEEQMDETESDNNISDFSEEMSNASDDYYATSHINNGLTDDEEEYDDDLDAPDDEEEE